MALSVLLLLVRLSALILVTKAHFMKCDDSESFRHLLPSISIKSLRNRTKSKGAFECLRFCGCENHVEQSFQVYLLSSWAEHYKNRALPTIRVSSATQSNYSNLDIRESAVIHPTGLARETKFRILSQNIVQSSVRSGNSKSF